LSQELPWKLSVRLDRPELRWPWSCALLATDCVLLPVDLRRAYVRIGVPRISDRDDREASACDEEGLSVEATADLILHRFFDRIACLTMHNIHCGLRITQNK